MNRQEKTLMMLQTLSPREERALRVRFGLDRPEREASEDQRLRLETEGLRKLRHAHRKLQAMQCWDRPVNV